ncbi:hypothetical protein [Naasia sp. SYSU D00948]|uniref:hypothetical protein n=1 Tax=Naasia sp. SYSU D00948 TaxID=2817379 RepID=UPI001B3080A3|nr:hypothetical protein [Naasia sp. SYSU D00948]
MKKMLAAFAVGAALVAGTAVPAHAAANPAQNKTSYWEAYTAYVPDTCYKVELGDGVASFSLPDIPSRQMYSLLVLKAGTGSEIISTRPRKLTAYSPSNGKDISHVIYCVTKRVS